VAPHLINWYGFLVLALLAVMEQLNAASVLPAGLNFLERVRALPVQIQEGVMHGLLPRSCISPGRRPPPFRRGLACGGAGFKPELPVQRAS
jgi:hypothetical protein